MISFEQTFLLKYAIVSSGLTQDILEVCAPIGSARLFYNFFQNLPYTFYYFQPNIFLARQKVNTMLDLLSLSCLVSGPE